MASAQEQQRVARADEVWARLLPDQQHLLVRHVAESRVAELRKAYPDLLAIGFGYRTTGLRGETLTSEPCVSFLVARKWTPRHASRGGNQSRCLPRRLFTHVHVDGAYQLCSIPTDVAASTHFDGIEVQSNLQIRAVAPGIEEVKGPLCCALRIPGDDGRLYALGCHHVLALSLHQADVTSSTIETNDAPAREVGVLSPFFGFVDDNGVFFDAALAEVSNTAALTQVLRLPFAGVVPVENATGIPDDLVIHTFKGGPVEARKKRVWLGSDAHADTLIKYPVLRLALGRPISPKVVVEVEPRVHTQPGDSGSPVLSSGGGIFAGMHVAGTTTGDRTSFFIPAYELLRASNYLAGSGDERLELAFPPF